MSLEFEIISGKRRTSKLLYIPSQGQLFTKKSSSNSSTYYVCYKKGCKSRVVLKNLVLSTITSEHNHGEQRDIYEEFKVLNQIKEGCSDAQTILGETNAISGIRETFRNTCTRNLEASKNIDFNKIKRNLQYLSNKIFLTSPKTPAEVKVAFERQSVMENFGFCRCAPNEDRAPFFRVCYEENDFAYCVFASEKVVKQIKANIPNHSSRKILVDGTFAVVPIGCFKQLLMMHVEYCDKIFPFLFVLMNKKSTKCYLHLFNYVNNNILQLDGSVFIADYENGLRKALKLSFPQCKLFGCWFHFCQAVRRYITTKNKELAAFIRRNKDASLEYHKILTLPLLPPEHIDIMFAKIKADVELFDEQLKFCKFMKYFEEQWLNKIGAAGISVFLTATRTTSALEAYNGVLGKIIPKHSNFFKFVQVLQNEDLHKSREMELLVNSGGTYGSNKRKKRSIEKAVKLGKNSAELRSGIITASCFINRMVFANYQTCVNMEPDEDLFEEFIYVDEEEDDEDMVEEVEVDGSQIRAMQMCVICFISVPSTVLLPCKHLKCCNVCVLKLQAESIGKGLQAYKCPVCRQDVNDTLQIFV